MKQNLLFVVLSFTIISHAQTKLNFSYDFSGNQQIRILCINCNSKPSKEIKDLTDEDLEKLPEMNMVSYYPNPVKEELYLQWELSENSSVISIEVFSMTGQLLNQYLTANKTNQNLPFQSYPSGVYIVLLKNSKEEEKSIKIIKQ